MTGPDEGSSAALLNQFTEKLLRRNKRVESPFDPIRPEAPFWAVGDLHGRSDLLDGLLPQLDVAPVIFVGDLIDRGPDSRGVLERIFALCSDEGQTYSALMGNHERLLLDFLEDPSGSGRAWLRYGGLQTLESYGVALGGTFPSDTACRDGRDALVEKMGSSLIDWLTHLPLIWLSGNVHVVHAGADPSCPMPRQDPHSLIWGHRDFERVKRADGQWVLHGHVIVPEPTLKDGRVAIDTGAYATGLLTAAHVSADNVDFVFSESIPT